MLIMKLHIIPTICLMFQDMSWLNATTAIWAVLGILLLIAGSAVVLMATTRKETQTSTRELATANADLAKTRELEIADITKKYSKQGVELEDITSEYRALVGIDIKVLMDYWATREHEIAAKQKVESENRVLKIRLGDIRE